MRLGALRECEDPFKGRSDIKRTPERQCSILQSFQKIVAAMSGMIAEAR
jgi:hypothetical protein